ncbi:MAG: leucine-rich repeat protein [Bacilli bacterium]
MRNRRVKTLTLFAIMGLVLISYGNTSVSFESSSSTTSGSNSETSSSSKVAVYYTITWVNYDGTILEVNDKVEENTKPVYTGKDPEKKGDAKASYTFSGWSPEVVNATSNATYTATYAETINGYTITWMNDDNTVLETDTDVKYGTLPTYDGAEPTKVSSSQYDYTFDGWNQDIATVTSDATYIATYSHVIRKYTVTWTNYDGTVLETDAGVDYGTVPTYDGTNPVKIVSGDTKGYIFNGWSPEVAAIEGDTTYVAQYKEMTVANITFKNADGTVLQETPVAYGTMPSYTGARPSYKTDSSVYVFKGWDSEITSATENKTYTATYYEFKNKNAVTFNTNGGSTGADYSYSVPDNYYIHSPKNPTKEGNYFAGWYVDAALTEKANFPYVVGTDSVNFYAKWATLEGNGNLDKLTFSYTAGTVATDTEAATDGFYTVTGCNEASVPSSIIIPDTYDDGTNGEHKVTSIGDNAFYKSAGGTANYCKTGLLSVIIGNNITYIGAKAFYYCSAMTDVVFGNGVETVGKASFEYCKALTSAALPASVKTLAGYTFANDSEIVSIDLHEGLETLSGSDF